MKIEKKKEDGNLFVKIELPLMGPMDEKVKLSTREVIALLKSEDEKFVFNRVIHNSMVCNYNPRNLVGIWVFELPQAVKKVFDPVPPVLDSMKDEPALPVEEEKPRQKTRKRKPSSGD